MIQQLISTAVGQTATAQGIPGFLMKFGDKEWQNLQVDEGGNIEVYLDGPITWDYTNITYLTERYPLRMMFMKKSELAMTPDEHSVITEACRVMVREFILVLSSMGYPITDANALEFWNAYDANYDGILFTFKITPDNEALC